MNRAQRRAEYRAARRSPVERSPRKRSALSFTTGLLMGAALPIVLMLAACGELGDERLTSDERYLMCIDRGGSWKSGGAYNDESCTIPEEGK